MELVKVYFAKTVGLEDEAVFSRLYNSLPEQRREKIDRAKTKSGKTASLSAGIILKKALKEEGISDINIKLNSNGKPYLDGVSDLFFNISHSEGMVMCAISDKEVGCDIEALRDFDIEIAKRFFCDEEYEQILNCKTKNEQNDMFLRLWTLKESFLKATGLGLSLPLNSFKVSFGDRKTNLFGNTYYLKELETEIGYKSSLCALSDKDVEIKNICLL